MKLVLLPLIAAALSIAAEEAKKPTEADAIAAAKLAYSRATSQLYLSEGLRKDALLLQRDMQLAQAEFEKRKAEWEAAADAVFKAAGKSKDLFDFNPETGTFTPKQKASAATK